MARVELAAGKSWNKDKIRRKKIKIKKADFYSNDSLRLSIFSFPL